MVSFSVSPWVLFWFLYYFLPCLGLHLVHCNQAHISPSLRLSPAGGQGLRSQSPSRLQGSAQAKQFLMQCLCN